MAASPIRRHETRALLRAHLAAASGYRHLTRKCPACRHLQRLATEAEPGAPDGTDTAPAPASGTTPAPGAEGPGTE
ncbi:DUF6274 family protein [Streptomyces sp. NPDC051018]|uniref:DUF6274 family protein n=1 Tax=Streptomyces sp. NPDC051018 TaxID=3365639 RepID=UPI0037AFF440